MRLKIVRLCSIFVLAVLFSVWASVSLAVEEAQESANLLYASGVVASVDASGGIVTLKPLANPGTTPTVQPLNFIVDAKTTLSKNQQKLSLADVQVGDEVTIAYTTKGSNNLASSILVDLPSGTTAPSTSSKP